MFLKSTPITAKFPLFPCAASAAWTQRTGAFAFCAGFRRRTVVSVGTRTPSGRTQKFKMAKSKTKSTKKLTKGALIQTILEEMGEGWARKDVKKVLEALTDIGHQELKKRGEFVLPGFAKFVVIKKPARPAREGINPFTKEPTVFAAKPASKVVKARPVKAIKDAIA